VEINLKRSDFQKNVLACAGVAPVRGINPVLCNILIETSGTDSVLLKATDTELGIVVKLAAEVNEAGSVLIHSKSLADVVRLLPEDNVKLLSKSDSEVNITSGRSKFRFNCLSPDDFPVIASSGDGDGVLVECTALHDAISKTIFAIPGDKVRHAVPGAHFKVGNGQLSITSTDNHRLVHCYFPVDSQIDIDVILPRKAFAEILKLAEIGGELALTYAENRLFVSADDKTLICQLVNGTFPDIISAIPKDSPNVLQVNRQQLISAIKRVNIFADEESALIFDIADEKTLRLNCNSSERGGGSDELEAEFSGTPMRIGFSSKYVLEVLGAMSEEKVRFDLSEAIAPALFRRCDDTSYSCIVMPMRLPGQDSE